MSAQQSSFIAGWWRDLRPALRHFLADQSGLKDPDAVADARWDSIAPEDQLRILNVARLVVSDLKPASWL